MLLAGWLLGGTVGIGTVVYAVCIGPLAHVFVPLFSRPALQPRMQSGDTSAPRPARLPSRLWAHSSGGNGSSASFGS